MSQKTNPISLRLEKKNQNFASPWFTDFFFTENLKHELEIRKYIDSFLEETGNCNAFFSAKSSYRKLNIFLAIQDTRVMRKEKQLLFNLKSSLSKRNKVAKQDNNPESQFILSSQNSYENRDFSSNRKTASLLSFDRFHKINSLAKETQYDNLLETQYDNLFLRKTIISDLLKEKLSYNKIPYSNTTKLCRLGLSRYSPYSLDSKSIFISYLTKIIKDRPYLSYSEKLLSKEFAERREKKLQGLYEDLALQNPQFKGGLSVKKGVLKMKNSNRFFINSSFHNSGKVNIYPIRFIKSSQNVIPLLDLVILLLEKRVSFREIKEKIFKDLSKNKMIKGVRITCCGRFGGKSKKAQKAKMQSDQWGQTSLSTFSSKLLFANKSANTSYGKIGIKIWIAFA